MVRSPEPVYPLQTPAPEITAMTITPDHRTQLQDHGYLVLRQALPLELIQSCQAWLEQWSESTIDTWISQAILDKEPESKDFRKKFYQAWRDAGEPHYDRSPRRPLILLDPERAFSILSHPVLLDITSQLLETDALLSHAVFNSRPKAPGQLFTQTPWHQDAQYFSEQAHRKMLNCWFPLHSVDASSSCLAVAPNHHQGDLHDRFDDPSGFLSIHPDVVERFEETPIPMEPGDILIFTNLTPHRAMPNLGDRMRWSMDLRFACAKEEGFQNPLDMVVRHPEENELTRYEDWKEAWFGAEGAY